MTARWNSLPGSVLVLSLLVVVFQSLVMLGRFSFWRQRRRFLVLQWNGMQIPQRIIHKFAHLTKVLTRSGLLSVCSPNEARAKSSQVKFNHQLCGLTIVPVVPWDPPPPPGGPQSTDKFLPRCFNVRKPQISCRLRNVTTTKKVVNFFFLGGG